MKMYHSVFFPNHTIFTYEIDKYYYVMYTNSKEIYIFRSLDSKEGHDRIADTMDEYVNNPELQFTIADVYNIMDLLSTQPYYY